jgi:transcriptional regulator with XRE-family HTH domain
MSDVVGLLLDDAMPPERLGALLRAARKRRGLKRKQAAAAARTTVVMLRAYERGEAVVPPAVCARLAECYGDDLTAHVPLRVPPTIAADGIAIGDESRVASGAADVIAGYVDIVRRLRRVGPGEPLPLRSTDLVALAGALGHDRAEIEARIAEVLGCSPAEARRLHGELLRRKVIVPVAGLAAGLAAFAGTAYAAQAGGSTHGSTPTTVAPAAAPTTTPTTAGPPATVPALRVIPPSPATTTTTVPAPPAPKWSPVPAPAAAAAADAEPSTPPGATTDATVPASERAADVPVDVTPQPNPDDPPVSILPGETPITIIGAPDSTVPEP